MLVSKLTAYLPRLPHVAFAVVLVGLCVAVGMGMAIFAIGTAAMVFSCLLLLTALLLPVPYLLALVLLTAFLITGQLQYFAGIEKAFWLSYLLGGIVWLRVLLHVGITAPQYPAMRLAGWLIGLFVVVTLFTTLVNYKSAMQILFGLKEYWMLLSVLCAIHVGCVDKRFSENLWRWVPWLAVAQLPAVLVQYLVYVPRRSDPSRWDAIVGLFGGNPMGGGASGAMALFLVFATVLSISRYKEGQISWRLPLLVSISAFVTIALAEVKVALFMMPLSVLLLYRAEVLRNPLKGIAVLLAGAMVSIAMLAIYQSQYDDPGSHSESLEAYLEKSVDRQGVEVNMQTGEMGRGFAIQFWFRENHFVEDPLHFLLGYGMGSSRQGAVMGLVADRYPFNLQRSTASVVLWEVGLIGLMLLAIILLLVIRKAWHLASSLPSGQDRAIANAILVGGAIALLCLPYNTDLHGVAAFQLLVILMAGHLLLVERQRGSIDAAQA